jgi:hypothetical protein
MPILNILIILGCLAGGYWLVSSIMGPGIDITRKPPPDQSGRDTDNAASNANVAPNPHDRDWHLILDIPAGANRREIEAAYKRRLAKAQSNGDEFERLRVQRAYEAALRRVKVQP